MFQQQLDYYIYESILTYRCCGGLLPYYSKTAHVQVREEVTLAAMKKGHHHLRLVFFVTLFLMCIILIVK